MKEILLSSKYKDYTINVMRDSYPESPRETQSSCGFMHCFHSRYRLGDKHSYSSPLELTETVVGQPNVVLWLPLYLYDHSGLSMSTTPFSCKWDSGQVGYIYATHQTILDCMLSGAMVAGATHLLELIDKLKQDNIDLRAIKRMLELEVEQYDHYLRGDVYAYEILKTEYNGTDEVFTSHNWYTDDLSLLTKDAQSEIDLMIKEELE